MLTISSQDSVDSSCDAGGCKETDRLSYVAGRMGGAVASVDGSFDCSELVAACPVLTSVEICLALASMTALRSALLARLRLLQVNWETQKLVDAQ